MMDEKFVEELTMFLDEHGYKLVEWDIKYDIFILSGIYPYYQLKVRKNSDIPVNPNGSGTIRVFYSQDD